MGCCRNPWQFRRNNACWLERSHDDDEILDVQVHRAHGRARCVACFQVVVVIEVATGDVMVKVVFYMHSVPSCLEVQSHTDPQISFIQKTCSQS